MAAPSRPLYERWIEKVEKTETCWLWRGAITENGYGVIQRGGRGRGLIRAHRFAYEHFVDLIPAGLDLRHTCHNRACVNPAHLLPGTRAENMADMITAGRQVNGRPMRGDENGNSRLSVADVMQIKVSGEQGIVLAARYGVSDSTISGIRTGQTWRHLRDADELRTNTA